MLRLRKKKMRPKAPYITDKVLPGIEKYHDLKSMLYNELRSSDTTCCGKKAKIIRKYADKLRKAQRMDNPL